MNKIDFIPFHPHPKDSTMQARRLLVKNVDITKSNSGQSNPHPLTDKKANHKYIKMIIKNLYAKISEMI